MAHALAGRLGPGDLQHGRRRVDAGRTSGRPDHAGQLERGRAAAAADIEGGLAGAGQQASQHGVAQGLEHGVEGGAERHPWLGRDPERAAHRHGHAHGP